MEKLAIRKRSKCHFCGFSVNDILKYGAIYKLRNITAHYFCVLLSSRLVQRGSDDEGLFGFHYHDIVEELNRTINVLCNYCKKGKATIKCGHKNCRKNFHLPCGLKKKCLNQFIGKFKSFCHLHCPVQNIPKEILKESCSTKPTCCICYENIIISKNKRNTLWAPCCQKAWYHSHCVQKFAYSAGYFFRCPACNDVRIFSQCVREFGIYIPQQDASWELVPNAFEELLFRYNQCDAKICLCPHGRQGKEGNQKWEVLVCESCGSQGIHVACGGFRYPDEDWECSECQKITKSNKFSISVSEYEVEEEPSNSLRLAEIRQMKRHRGSEDLENVLNSRKKCKQDLQDEDIEIDVVTVDGETKADKNKISGAIEEAKDVCETNNRERKEVGRQDPQEALTSIRPGPLSYKLGLLRKALKNSQSRTISLNEERRASIWAKSASFDVLSNSEEQRADEHEDIEVIKEIERPTFKIRLNSNFPEKANKVTVDPSSSETKKTFDLVIFSNDSAKTRDQSSFSLDDFVDLKTVMTFHSSGGRKKNGDPLDGVHTNTEGVATLQYCNKHLSVNPVSLFESFAEYSEAKTSTQNLKLIETERKKEGLNQIVEDDVIILSD